MESVAVEKKDNVLKTSVRLPFSKSISNRLLIIEALCEKKFPLKNISTADDTILLQRLLSSSERILDAQNAGTCFRFLTAYLAQKNGEWILTGSERMKQRPIGELVNALRKLGAEIKYMEKENFPPLLIHGKKLKGGEIKIDASQSSQFVSALLLIAPYVEGGISLNIEGEISSGSYIDMTLKLMENFGIKILRRENNIKIVQQEFIPKEYFVEPDWSSAAFWYAMAAMSEDVEIFLEGLSAQSIQGDSIISELMKNFGVETRFANGGAVITKKGNSIPEKFSFNFSQHPDLAPAFFVLCSALGVDAKISGIRNLSIKESNRTEALKTELEKCEEKILKVSSDEYSVRPHPLIPSPASSVPLKGGTPSPKEKGSGIFSFGEGEHSRKFKTEVLQFETYNDHRLAMAFAMLAIPLGKVEIKNPAVVSKSYPEFWNDLRSAGFAVKFS